MTARERLHAARWSFWIPFVACVIAVAATVLSAFQPQWIEHIFGASPDAGSGESEWWITAILGAIGVMSLALTGWRWRRIQPAT